MNQYLNVNIMALLPCPLKVQLEKLMTDKIKEVSARTGETITYKLVSNAVLQENVFEEMDQLNSIDELPEIMIAPGIGRFFHPVFVQRFRETGCFSTVSTEQNSKIFTDNGMYDPHGHYDMMAFNPLIFLVDKTRTPDLETPHSWMDLTKEDYRRKVSYRGKDDRSYCEGVLFSLYQMGGEEAIHKLGGSVKSRLHPAEMAKLAGSRREEAPEVSVIPVTFATMAKAKPSVEMVYPTEGASVNPVVMLTKTNASEGIKEIARYLMSEEVGKLFQQVGFIHQGYATPEEEEQPYAWCGWDFLVDNNVEEVNDRLNQIMFDETRDIHQNSNQGHSEGHGHGKGHGEGHCKGHGHGEGHGHGKEHKGCCSCGS